MKILQHISNNCIPILLSRNAKIIYSFIHLFLILGSLSGIITLCVISTNYSFNEGYDCFVERNLNISCQTECYNYESKEHTCDGLLFWVCHNKNSNILICNKLCLSLKDAQQDERMYCYYNRDKIYQNMPIEPNWIGYILLSIMFPFPYLFFCCHSRIYHVRIWF